jgi:high-affinity nickel-transport protein
MGATYWALRNANLEVPAVGFAASAGLGTLLGMKHAIEPDHLAAVSTLMTGERSSARAALVGACWGFGHALTLLATGALLVVLHAEMPGAAVLAFEVCVVLLLVVFGVRAIYLGLGRGIGAPTHTHGQPARARLSSDRWTLARPLLIGAVHGLAGSGALTALVVTTLPSSAAQLGYLTLFGVGSILGMAALSGLLGWPIARLGTHHVVARAFSMTAGGVSVALALSWAHPILQRLL